MKKATDRRVENLMRKAKIVCTMGPSTDAPGVLEALIKNGMDVARFNFSHGDHREHEVRMQELRKLSSGLDRPVAAMLDTGGPEIRLGTFFNGREELKAGQSFILTTKEVQGDGHRCSVSYPGLTCDVKAGDRIMLDDGLIGLIVERVEGTEIFCRVENDGVIKSKKSVNVPGAHLSMPYMSEKDREDILFGIRMGFDLISASFTRTAKDILEIKRLLDDNGTQMRIIAKIENSEGVEHIDEILKVADGIMVARGDMGVEIDFTEIPAIQKRLIDRAIKAGKPVITATQMLDSMMINPRPTRAEITDVANAIYDGTTAVMLSGETAAGKYPVEALKVMSAIVKATETGADFCRLSHNVQGEEAQMTVNQATACAAAGVADHIEAAAILIISKSGETVRLMSGCRPKTPMIACVLEESVRRRANFYWGIRPVIMDTADSTDELIENAIRAAKAHGMVADGDTVVVTAGVPVGVPGTTNMIKVHVVGE